MWLKQLDLTNFRSCADAKVCLSADITVLVGENASGKSAIIDAIRAITTSALERGSFSYSAEADVHRNSTPEAAVEIAARFVDLSEGQKAVFMTELVDEHDELVYRTSFSRDPDEPYWKTNRFSVGDARAEDPEPLNRRRIAHVYLPPLRDAVRELDSGGGERLAEVLRVMTSRDLPGRKVFSDDANSKVAEIAALELPLAVQREIQKHLTGMTPPTRRHSVRLGGRDQEIRRLAGLMRMQLSDAHIDAMRIASSGLGYASLLYIATIVVQLANAKDYDLTILLVEEPEAHLHPQLQSVLLEYLKKQAQDSHNSEGSEPSLEPAGQVQIVVTTHSPNLASSVSIKEVVVVSRTVIDSGVETLAEERVAIDEGVSSGSETTELGSNSWETKTTALKDLGIDSKAVRKIDRYLTATRSSLLFARHVVLVEGIAEAILLPVFAKYVQFPGNDRVQRHLSSCSFIAIDGVDFEPYLSLLLSGDHPRLEKVIVVTDRDIDKNGREAGEARKEKYYAKYAEAFDRGRLKVFVGLQTFEADIFAASANEPIMKDAYHAMHPLSDNKWDELVASVTDDSSEGRAKNFSDAIKTKTGSLDIGKGDFAQLIAEAIEDPSVDTSDFVTPSYIADAITELCSEVAGSPEED